MRVFEHLFGLGKLLTKYFSEAKWNICRTLFISDWISRTVSTDVKKKIVFIESICYKISFLLFRARILNCTDVCNGNVLILNFKRILAGKFVLIKTLIRSHNSYALLSLTALHRQLSYFLAALLIFLGWKCWNSLTLTYLSSIFWGGFPYKKTWMLVISRLFSGRRGSESFIWIGTPPPFTE